MKTINYEDLCFIENFEDDPFDFGTSGEIRRCIFNNKKYACKTFFNNEYLKVKIKKLDSLGNLEIPGLLLPRYWVKNELPHNAYLSEFSDKYYIDKLKRYFFTNKN